ncbi:MAG: DUF2087 domain-containing protein [Syntrophomonadaceae bacterium]|jgi:hypothetical protein|nr:DUF2087 domain-containing protein [Syntrophomonadaceae bacterium]
MMILSANDFSAIKITQFLDEAGKIKSLPSKYHVRLAVLFYLSQKFAIHRNYTEKEINDLINQWHVFRDYFILRREMVDAGFMNREKDGSRYWRPEVK